MIKKLLLLLFVLPFAGCQQPEVPIAESQYIAPQHIDQCVYPIPGEDSDVPLPNPVKAFYTTALVPEEQELADVQVPVPRNCRILNLKGNCVWCSMEVAARYAGIEELYNITKNPSQGGDPHCQGAATPDMVRSYLDSRHIKYEMIQDKNNIDWLEQKVKVERRPVCFALPKHMMNLVHVDKEAGIVKVIDNADYHLSVQTWSWDKFMRLWSGWSYVIIGDPDLVPYKYDPWCLIPVLDGYTGKLIANDRTYFPVPH